ncbi:MAG: sensor histidine kinase [Acidimicrobiia bacterium]
MLRPEAADDLSVTLDSSRRSPSGAWLVGAGLAGLLAIGSLVGAFFHQQSVDRPVGEGELFVADAAQARAELEKAGTTDVQTAVRRVRNLLAIEAVSLVGADGHIVASTSTNQEGVQIENGLLLYGLSSGFFSAVATSTDNEIQIDGVTEWERGEILYHVLEPLDDGEGLLLYYDVSELLARRARQQGIQPLTLELVGVGAFFIVAGILLLIARSAVARRIRDMEVESQFLRQQSAELEEHNRQLAVARAEAERALALAEEKNRIRAEFVLMINHELRTPLTSLVTGAELLRQLELPEADRVQLLSHMVADGRRLQEMIAQMLTVARIENRGLNFTLRDVPFAEVLADLAEKHPRLRIQHRAGGTDPRSVYVRTDPMTLSQLVASLADNALSHGATRVDLVWRESLPFHAMHEVGHKPDPALFLLVIDDGPGIDSAFLPRAFEKFEKHSQSAGTGLGLYIARMMVDALEGSLAVHSSHHGTTMAIGVPLGRRLLVESAA